jgi:hypothetical protein
MAMNTTDLETWGRTDSRTGWLGYARPGLILRCSFEPREARLIAETMDDRGECRIIANVELCCSRSVSALPERIVEFASAVKEFIRTLPAVTDVPHGDDT